MKLSAVFDKVISLIKANRPVFLWGPPGVGKSDIVAQIAKHLKRKLTDVRAVLLDPVDLRGIPTVEDGVTKWNPPSFLPVGKEKVILFLDELNAAPPLIQAACYQLILDRRLGEYVLPDNVYICAAGNRETDRAVTSRMSSALASRFVHVDVDVDLDDWVKWALNAGVQTELIAFLRYRPALLHQFDAKKNDKAFPCPRTWEFVNDILAVGESDYELISGTVGQGAASEFIGFLDIYRNLPDPDLVIMSPEKADVPQDPATLYAICGALAHRASDQNFNNIVKYANRLPVEFSVLLVKDAIERDDKLVSSRAFIEWSADHSDVLI